MGRWLLILTGLIVVLVGCGGDDDDNEGANACINPPLVAGQWSGTITDEALGAGTITGPFTQDGCVLVVNLQLCFAEGCGTGTLVAEIDGTEITGNLGFSPNCHDEITATFVPTSPPQIVGTYVGHQCATVGGSFEMTLIAP